MIACASDDENSLVIDQGERLRFLFGGRPVWSLSADFYAVPIAIGAIVIRQLANNLLSKLVINKILEAACRHKADQDGAQNDAHQADSQEGER